MCIYIYIYIVERHLALSTRLPLGWRYAKLIAQVTAVMPKRTRLSFASLAPVIVDGPSVTH